MDTSAKASKGRLHLTGGRVIDTKGVVGLREEKERLDAKKEKKPKN